MKLIKYILFPLILLGFLIHIPFSTSAQEASKGMEVKQNNFTSFRHNSESVKNISSWKKLNLPQFYSHPEFGKLPFNAPCEECVEILDRRTGDYRYFIDANDHQKFYVQKSLGDINFLENNYWVAKDVSLKAITNTIFESRKSNQKVGVDVENKRTYIETVSGKIFFNQWKLIGLNGTSETFIANANWDNYTIGEDGIKITNVFPHVDAQLMVLNGAIKTNFVIKENAFTQYENLVFRDEMDASQPVSLSFKNSTDLISAGDMNVHVGSQKLLEIAEGFAFPLNGAKNKTIILNYTHRANSLDVIVPLDWVALNIASGPIVVDPLVTGTATLAQAAITGSMYNASCNFTNSCDYALTIPTPPQATFTDVRFSFAYITAGICWLEDGAMKFQIGSCISPSAATTYFFCNDAYGGTCTGTNLSVFPEVSSCLPPPSCVSQNVVMTLKFYRSCFGAGGCSNACIGANSPYIGVIEGSTLEFVNAVAPITLATTVCQGQSLTASTAATAGVGPFTYNWSFNASGTPSLGTTTSQAITFPTAGSQTVHLRVTDACGNVVNSSKVVNVTASPTATAASNSPVCVGSPINLTGTAAPAATSYAWTGPGGYTSATQNPTIASATLANAGTYSLIVTNGGCPSPAAQTVVVVNPRPIAAPTSNSPVCLGGTLNLSGNTLPGTTTYSWTGPGGFTSTSQNPIITPMTAATAGTYTLTVTNGGCTSLPINVAVAVGPSPTATPTSNSPICAGANLVLSSNLVAGATYAWSGPNGFTSTVQNPTINAATAAAAGTYTLTITNGGCSSTPTTTAVVVNPIPTATASNNGPLCVGGSLTLTGSATPAATGYSWTGPGGFTSASQNPTINPVTAATAGTYSLTVTNAGCTSAPATTAVVVNPLPIATPTSNSPICLGGNLNLAGNTLPGTTTYSWTGPGGFTSTLQNPTITPMTAATAGTYTLTVTNGGCTSLPVNVTVAVGPSPTATPTSNSPICAGANLVLSSNTVAGATYAWSGPGGFTSTSQNPTINAATAAASGVYTLTITNGGCSSTPATTTVVVNPVPTATASSNTPVCVGDALNLTGNTVAGTTTYSWTGPNGFTSTSQSPTINPATAAASGTYTYTLTNGGCTSAPVTTTVVVTAAPVATASSTSPLCIGSPLNLTGNAITGATYAWTGPNGFTSALQSPSIASITAAGAGVYSLTITDGGCTSAPATTTVVVNPTPTATASSNSPQCVGGTLNLNSNSIVGATYAWTGPNGFTSASANPIITPLTTAEAGTYSLIITNGGCASTASTTTVVVNAVPVATPNYNAGVCAGGSLDLTANTVAGATYAWTGPNGFTSSVQNPIINPITAAAAGIYTLTITNGGCTSAPATVNVVISPAPTATASYNVGVCESGTLNLTANTVPSGTYAWTGPNGFTSAVQNPIINSVTALAAGTYNLTITVSGCAPATASVTVVVNPGPSATATTNSPICSGSTLNLNATTVTNATYAWTGPNGFTSALQNPTIPGATSAASGAYTLSVTTPGCAPASTTLNVVVTNNPIATASSNAPICLGETLNLSAATVAGATYAWTGPNSFTSTQQNPSIPNTTALNTGTYSLIVTVGICQSAVSTTSVSFHPSPIVNVTQTDALCNGGTSGTATATPTVAGTYTYAWSPSGGNAATASNLAAGVYTVVTTNSNGCTSSNSITITQPTSISLTMSSTQSACALNSGTATVVATGGSGAYSYAWSPSGGNAATANNLAVGAYSVTVTDGNGCTKVGNVNVVSANPPVITIANITNINCFGLSTGSATITVNGGSPGYTYDWLPSVGSGPSVSNLPAGQYSVTVTDNVGCTAVETINISSPAELLVSTSGNGADCGSLNGSATANASGGSGTYTYLWTPGNFTTQTINNIPSGTYSVVVTDANSCNVTETYNVNQIGGLNIQVNPVMAVIYEGESVNLNATTNPYIAGTLYSWSPSSGLSCSDCPNPTANPNTSTVYTITMTTPDGCKDSVTSTITIKINCGEYFIPTIFSPNGDGQNDVFKIYGKCIVGIDLKIFNRWGEKVFESYDQEFGWDGTQKGQLVSSDSYYYYAKISFEDGTFINEKGSINVVR